MKKIFVLLITINFFSACKSQPSPKVWTKQYEQGLYNYLESVTKPNIPDSTKRLAYITFYIQRAKQEIPNGLNSVSKDSLRNLNIRIGREYAVKLKYEGKDIGMKPYFEKWTPLIEKTFKNDFAVIFKSKGVELSSKYCDCVIEKLKKIYPDSILVPTPQPIITQVAIGCKNKLEPK